MRKLSIHQTETSLNTRRDRKPDWKPPKVNPNRKAQAKLNARLAGYANIGKYSGHATPAGAFTQPGSNNPHK